MKIIIETKYNIGDIVYVADHYYDFYACRQPFIITNVKIVANSQTKSILYEVKQNDLTDYVSEDCIFGTYEECKKWCDKHN